MAANYRCFNVTASSTENVVTKIYEQLQEEGYHNANFQLHFVGFEADEGTEFKLNGNRMVVPASGYCITPYEDEWYLNVYDLKMNDGCSDMKFWCIY